MIKGMGSAIGRFAPSLDFQFIPFLPFLMSSSFVSHRKRKAKKEKGKINETNQAFKT
jgi:hypothetical protein